MHFGMSGSDVHELQKYLNAHGFAVAAAGEGSLGTETTNFGQGTKQALIRFQNAHAAEILTPAGLTEGSGILGALTRQYINTHP
jgi:peptidoglycan hydrolase-like protein with peptidoglycan-binding domain